MKVTAQKALKTGFGLGLLTLSQGKKLAKQLQKELGLNENTYIKTGGATGAKAKKKKKLNPPMDPEMKRIENDVTFNYSRSEFKFEEQPKTSSN